VTNICKEIDLLTRIDHVNVVKIYEYYIYTTDIFIVMEFLNGGELFYRITEQRNSMTLGFVRKIMIQLLESLSYMHHHNIGKDF
jgi:serine/threonine protein kinase